jgi:hypothetical protein
MGNLARWRRSILFAACAGTAFLAFGSAGAGQPKEADDPKKDPLPVFPFVETPMGIRIGAAMQLFATPNPIVLAANRLAATTGNMAPLLSPEWDLTLEAPLPLPHRLLADLHDGTPVPGDLTKKDPKSWSAEERAYLQLLNDALIYSTLVPFDLFERAGKVNNYVTFDHLWLKPDEYRGEIVPVIGHMKLLRKWKAPSKAQENGIEFVYEGWVDGPTAKRNPYCILFADLPKGLEPSEKLDVPATFYGYYIKKFRYEATNSKRVTHLLIGPTVRVHAKADTPASTPFTRDVLYATVGGLFALGALIITMHWWFHRGDRRIQSRLAALRDKEPFTLNGDEPADPQSPSGVGTPEPRNGP